MSIPHNCVSATGIELHVDLYSTSCQVPKFHPEFHSPLCWALQSYIKVVQWLVVSEKGCSHLSLHSQVAYSHVDRTISWALPLVWPVRYVQNAYMTARKWTPQMERK